VTSSDFDFLQENKRGDFRNTVYIIQLELREW